MQHNTSDMLFSLFNMTFNLKGSVDQEFSLIVKIIKTTFFLANSKTNHIFCLSSITRLKQDARRYISYFIFCI